MSKKMSKKRSPEQVAEAAKIGWRAVKIQKSEDMSVDGDHHQAADAAVPELDVQRNKYGRRSKKAKQLVQGHVGGSKDLSFVTMEPEIPTDAHIGRKVIVVDDDQVIGEQG